MPVTNEMKMRLTNTLITLLTLLSISTTSLANDALIVYKDPNCGCCAKWVEHLNENKINAKAENSNNMAHIKALYGIPTSSQSCHTAITTDNKYVFEGHVPAASIQRFLKEKPQGAIGLAVAGMPIGSPGMEVGKKIQAYDVLLIMSDGTTQVFETINSLQ